MADRIPLIVNSGANQIQELPTSDNLVLNDTNKLIVGTDGELQISHDSSGNSVISHNPPSSGNLDLRLKIGGNQFVLEKTSGKNFIVASHNDFSASPNEVSLFYADDSNTDAQNKKLTTKSTGIDINGNLNVSGLIRPSSGTAAAGAGISFTPNPGGGSGDFATITYEHESGTEKTNLKIAVENDGAGTPGPDNIELSTPTGASIKITSNTPSTSSTSGALVVTGGVGISEKLFVGGTFNLASGVAVNSILDEDNMDANSATALATQQSIRAYVDNSISSSGQALTVNADTGGSKSVILATGELHFKGTTSEINTVTSQSGSGNTIKEITIGLPNDVTIGQDLTVTRNLSADKATINHIELDDSKILIGSGDELDIHYESSSGTSRILHDPPSSGNSDDLRLQITRNQLILEKKVDASTNGHNFITCDFASNETRICFADQLNGSPKLTTKSTGADITGILNVSGKINANDATDSSNSTSGSLIVDGGVGIAKKLFVGTNLNVGGTFGFGSGQTVNSILNQNGLNANSSSALATQSSIKAYADNLDEVNGNFKVNGNLVVDGQTTINDSLLINTASEVFRIRNGSSAVNQFLVDTDNGNTTIQGSLNVNGVTDIDADFAVRNGTTNKFFVDNVTGNTTIQGNALIESNLNVNGTVDVDANFAVRSGTTDKFTVASSSGNTVIKGTLATQGDNTLGDNTGDDTTISGKLFVNQTQDATSTSTGALRVEGGILCKKALVVGDGGIMFKGGDTNGNNVKLNPGGSAPIIGVRAYGFIQFKKEDGEFQAANSVNIDKYVREDEDAAGMGRYKIFFEHAMPHANYAVMLTPDFIDGESGDATRNNGAIVYLRHANRTTTSCIVVGTDSAHDPTDRKDVSFSIAIIC